MQQKVKITLTSCRLEYIYFRFALLYNRKISLVGAWFNNQTKGLVLNITENTVEYLMGNWFIFKLEIIVKKISYKSVLEWRTIT